MKCPKCNKDELFLYRETCIALDIPITKKNTLSKRNIRKNDKTYGMPDYVECGNCGKTFDYDINEKEQIFDLVCREDY